MVWHLYVGKLVRNREREKKMTDYTTRLGEALEDAEHALEVFDNGCSKYAYIGAIRNLMSKGE